VENRRALSALVLAGETELYRAYRQYAGVMHFVYLSSSEPGGFTSDNFVNLQTLQLEPHFAAAMEQAFKPLGVYLNFWHATIKVNEEGSYTIYMVNDEDRPRAGNLRLVFTDAKGTQTAAEGIRFSMPALGAQSYTAILRAPAIPGHYQLQALAQADDDSSPTISTREVSLQVAAAGN